MDPSRKVWFITGTSSGLGRCLVSSALARGDCVIATVRHLEDFALPDVDRSRLRVVVLDVTDTEENIQTAVDDALTFWGRVDVLVNNAGYASKCMVEEGRSSAAIAQFHTNFFGALKVTNAVIPHMRQRRSGTLVFLGSRSVWQANVPAVGFYIASKAAIHAMSECLAAELAEFGIRILLIAPGGFRTGSNDRISYTMNRHVPAYDGTRENVLKNLDEYWKHAKGDPAKAMEVLVDVVRSEGKAKGRELPGFLLLGNPAYVQGRAHCEQMVQNMDSWEDIAKDLDFDSDE
ncbi:NAD(P)-binding protein [Wolfiporia cocos MD-104 SS10]|uniref:NAD(P)-binding protein n=1 Tax=Wolfiporia cocos (strain MD-104) TaxID=742152 RepID=A0A2H3JRS9_WOLCO|nr:NAD(P)-binding protein [Wolfiporia cocos MD-104 SS10]